MIVVDSSEVRKGTKMPSIEGAVESPILEELTGADFMISTLNAPPVTETLIQKHVDNGALLVQRKSGLDLSSSIGERLNKSLSKMIKMDTMQAQCILLFIGFMTEVDGKCHINKQDTRLDFFTVQGAISKWHDRGGVVEFLPKPSLVEQWCKMKIAHLEEYKRKPIKEQYPEKPIINVKKRVATNRHSG